MLRESNEIKLPSQRALQDYTYYTNSIVIYPNSVTTLWLARFDGRIEFQGPFLKKFSSQVPPKNASNFF